MYGTSLPGMAWQWDQLLPDTVHQLSSESKQSMPDSDDI